MVTIDNFALRLENLLGEKTLLRFMQSIEEALDLLDKQGKKERVLINGKRKNNKESKNI